jgi:CHAD domain-containing protein
MPPEVSVDRVHPDATVSAVLRQALAASVSHLLRNDVVMRLDADPEGVHQARVASRRLRSDLRTFRTLLDPEWAEPLRDELRWLGTVLGEARDADVLLDRLQRRSPTIPPTEAPGAGQVVEALAQRRKEAHAALIDALRTERYVSLLDRLVDAASRPAVPPELDVAAKTVAAGLLDRPWEHLRTAVREAGGHPTDAELHVIRIRAKRVRYAAETVVPLLGRSVRRSAEAASRLQTVLGEHHDAIVAESWLRTWAVGHRSGDAAFAAGMLAGLERAAAQDARDRWRKGWKKLSAAQEDR